MNPFESPKGGQKPVERNNNWVLGTVWTYVTGVFPIIYLCLPSTRPYAFYTCIAFLVFSGTLVLGCIDNKVPSSSLKYTWLPVVVVLGITCLLPERHAVTDYKVFSLVMLTYWYGVSVTVALFHRPSGHSSSG